MAIHLSADDESFRGMVRDFLNGALTEPLRDAARKRTSLWQDIDSSMN